MAVYLAGLDHHTAPLEVRERVAVPRDRAAAFVRAVRAQAWCEEAMLLSTCNRTELYVVSGMPDAGERALGSLLGALPGAPPADSGVYRVREEDAAGEHLFRVAVGLESAIVGESEVQGQVRQALDVAAEVAGAGKVLDRLVRGALHAGKRARTETAIGAGGLTHGGAAAEVARRVFGNLRHRTVLVVGAGQAAQQAARALAGLGGGTFVLANRTREHAEALAREIPAATATSLDAVPERLGEAHVVVLASEGVPLSLSAVEATLARRRDPLLVVDLGVPRAADPLVASLPGVFLYDLEALEALVQSTVAARREAVPAAEAIVAEEFGRFRAWARTLSAHGTLQSLHEWAEEVRRAEVAYLPPEASADVRRAVEEITRRLVRKILDRPASRVVQGMEQEDPSLPTAESLRRLFGLEDGGSS